MTQQYNFLTQETSDSCFHRVHNPGIIFNNALLSIPKTSDHYSQGVLEVREVLDLCSEEQVSKLGEGEEDDEEHDGETRQVLGTLAQGGRQLRHRLVETDVLEDLHTTKVCCWSTN